MRRSKRLMAFLMSVMMVVSFVFNGQLSGGYRVYAEEEVASDTDATEATDVNFDNSTYVGDNYEVTLTLDSYWDSGYNATITIKNTGDTVIENWCMAFPLEQNISNIWNANIEEVHEDYFVIKNAGWNQDIAVGGSVSFGITCYEAFSVYPEYYTLLGNEVELASGDYSVAYEITEDWGEGYKALVTITNNKSVALEDWRIKFNYGDNVITQIWDAVIVNNTDGVYEISCESYNQNITAGGSVSFEFLVEPGTSDADISKLILSEYMVNGDAADNETKESSGDESDKEVYDTSDENVGDDSNKEPKDNTEDITDENLEEINLEDAFVGLLCEVDENKKELELYMFSNIECSKYEIYVSYDAIEYTLYDTTEEEFYYFSMNDDDTYVRFYVKGYYNEEIYVSSPWLYVSHRYGNYSVHMENTDADNLSDSYELYFGTNLNDVDTDKDGLNDNYELYASLTEPTLEDTDGNGVFDACEDFDGDGLTTKQEANNSTDVWDADTDDDFLSDGEEVNIYYTKPRIADTDKDGLKDGDEVVLGTNPLVMDTDGDGIFDSGELHQQNYVYRVRDEACTIDEISVDVLSRDCFQNRTVIESVMNKDYHSSRVVGLYGEPFEIETTARFDTAILSFKIDKDSLGDIPFENLMFLWYDEAGKQFVELETTHDEKNGIVSTQTTHFSKYMLVDREEWYAAWATELDYGGAEGPNQINTILCIDCSVSMIECDPIFTNNNVSSAEEAKYRKTCGRIKGACTYIDMMSENDKTAIVFFNDGIISKSNFTSDKQELKLYMQEISDIGNTDFDAPLKVSLDYFTEDMLNDPNACNMVVILSDGNGQYLEETLNMYVEKRIQIFCVGVGKGASDTILKSIAETTGGQYFKVNKEKYLSSIYEKIYVQRTFEVTDDDEDGLYDEVESIGIRLIDGTIIYTDPNDDDSDDDGLLDGEEIDTTPIFYTKLFATQEVLGYMFTMNSDPNNPDTDGDSIIDSVDSSPKEKGIYSSDVNNLVVGELTIVSTDRGLVGHSYLLYESYIPDVLDCTGFTGGFSLYRNEQGVWCYDEKIASYISATIGEYITFGNTSASLGQLGSSFETEEEVSDGDIAGIYYNREFAEEIYIYNLGGNEEYRDSVAYSREITEEQLETMFDMLNQLNYYHLTENNCAIVAAKSWNAAFDSKFAEEIFPSKLKKYLNNLSGSYEISLLEILGLK